MTIYFALLNQNIYWLLLLLTALIVAVTGLVLYFAKSKQASSFKQTIEHTNAKLAEIGERKMDYQGHVRAILDQGQVPELTAAYDNLLQHAKADYEEQYMPNPSPLATAIRQNRGYKGMLSGSISLPVILGLVSAILLIVCQQFLTGTSALMLAASLFPVLLGLGFTYLIQSSLVAMRIEIDYQIEHMLDLIHLALPVYNSDAASALLVDRFVRYNEQLSQSAKDLVGDAVILGVSENLEALMLRDVVPALTENSKLIAKLATTLTDEQTKKMDELAEHFSTAISSRLDSLILPIAEQVTNYSALMATNEERSQQGLEHFKLHREALDLVSAEIQASLQQLQTERGTWQEERRSLDTSLTALTEAGTRLTELQNSAADLLASRIGSLGDQLDRHMQESEKTLEKLYSVNDRLEGLLHDANEESLRTVTDYRVLGSEIKQAAKNMEQMNATLIENIGLLNRSLEDSVGGFREQLQTQVNSTLDDFDKGLAEVSLRLSHSVTEIRDTASDIHRLTER